MCSVVLCTGCVGWEVQAACVVCVPRMVCLRGVACVLVCGTCSMCLVCVCVFWVVACLACVPSVFVRVCVCVYVTAPRSMALALRKAFVACGYVWEDSMYHRIFVSHVCSMFSVCRVGG